MAQQNLISKIASSTGILAKSFLGFDSGIAGGLSTQLLAPNGYRQSSGTALGDNGWLFDQAGGFDVYFNYNGLSDIVTAYECCPPVYSIINKQALAITNGKTVIVNSKEKESTSPYANKIRALLAKPNALQNGRQFEAQAAIYMRLFGYCVILPVRPVGFGVEDSIALWIIPPYMCTFEFAKQTFYNLKKGFISKVTVKYGDEISVFNNPDDLIILRDITPGFETMFLPGSPIKALKQNINNLIGIYQSKGMLISYRGALGILTPELDPAGAISMTDPEKLSLQNQLMRYGLRQGQSKFIISNTSMKWQQMGYPYRDLMLTEWGEDDIMILCDVLNYPFKLMASNTRGSSINGTEVKEFKTQLYQDFTIPFADMMYEQLSEDLQADQNNCTIKKDYSHLPILQEDDQKKAQARKTRNDALLIEFNNNLITLNRWLTLNNEDPMPNEFGDKYYYELINLGWKFGSTGVQVQPGNSGQSQPVTPLN